MDIQHRSHTIRPFILQSLILILLFVQAFHRRFRSAIVMFLLLELLLLLFPSDPLFLDDDPFGLYPFDPSDLPPFLTTNDPPGFLWPAERLQEMLGGLVAGRKRDENFDDEDVRRRRDLGVGESLEVCLDTRGEREISQKEEP